jgi:hypothetical protein
VEQLRREVFALAYHLKWSQAEILNLDLQERREYLRLLSEQIERESQAVQRARQHRTI